MDISVYSDESGTFDCVRGQYFVFGGLIFLSPAERESFTRQYSALEKTIRSERSVPEEQELKAIMVVKWLSKMLSENSCLNITKV